MTQRKMGSLIAMRRRAREAALQTLYACDFHNIWTTEFADYCLLHFDISEDSCPYAYTLCRGCVNGLTAIDTRITAASEHWSISRMGIVDRNILRLGTYEMVYEEEIPPLVSVNEAIEVAKRFGSSETPTFINGVLDRIAEKAGLALKRKVENLSKEEEEMPLAENS